MEVFMYPLVKRILDIVLALSIMLVLLPLTLVLLLLIRIDSPGNPIFTQQRIGRHGLCFRIFKLRTMYTTAPHSTATAALEDSDSYITRVGRILRKTSLDELPQLINVLKGDMSIIGPRPLVPEEKEIHLLRKERNVYRVRPGITGWAQVNGRDCVKPLDKANLDAYYVEHLSFWLDVRVLIYSVFCVLTARGVREGATDFDEEIDEQNRAKRKNKESV